MTARLAISVALCLCGGVCFAGGTFTIRAEGAGRGLRYIKSASLNGKPYDRPFLSHADLTAGGELILEMDSRPNKAWGANPAAR